MLPGDTSSEFTLEAEQSTIKFFLPLYSKPTKEDPKRLIFSLDGVNNGSTIGGSVVSIIINILDDGNNGFDLNDTGITQCYDDAQNLIVCSHATYPNQDGSTGLQNQFSKYNFVKEAPEPTPARLDLTTYKCVYDQTTGLLWEVVTDPNISYTWYDDNPTTNGGASGVQIVDDGSTIDRTGSTQAHADAINESAVSLCGVGIGLDNKTGKWRLPKVNELLSIMDFETPGGIDSPFIDYELFKLSPSSAYFWTSSPSAIDSDKAWCVSFAKVIKDSVKLCAKKDAHPAIMVSTVEIIP